VFVYRTWTKKYVKAENNEARNCERGELCVGVPGQP